MRTGKMRSGAGLAVALLLAGAAVHAQDVTLPPLGGPGQPKPLPTSTTTKPSLTPVPGTGPASATTLGAPVSGPASVPVLGGPVAPPVTMPHVEGTQMPVAEPLKPAGEGHEGPEGHGMEAHGEGHGPEGEAESEDVNVVLWGDYLLLHPRRNAFDFAIYGTDRSVLPGGDIVSADYGTNSAFRLGGAYRLSEGWQLGAEYTYLHTNGSRALTEPQGGQLFATASRAGGIDEVAAAGAAANINYNVLNLEAGKKICAGESLDLVVSGGGTIAIIDQKFDVFYDGGPSGAHQYHVSSPDYFRGAGLTAAAEGTWRIYRGFGLYGRVRGSLVSGQFRHDLVETNNSGATTIVNLHEQSYQVVPEVELGLGFSFEYEHLYIKAGYELTNWFGMVNSPDVASPSETGRLDRRSSDLSLEGLAVRIGLMF